MSVSIADMFLTRGRRPAALAVNGGGVAAAGAAASGVATVVAPAGARREGTYATLDAWRGVACLWVVCHHALGFLAERDPAVGANVGYAVALNGALGVWMFFVISGYCIANTAANTLTTGRGGWVYHRLRRIYPPMWASAVLAVGSILLARALVRHGELAVSSLGTLDVLHQSAGFYLANLTLTQEPLRQPYLSGVFWTLCYEVGFYAVVAAALAWARRHGDARRLLNVLHVVTVASVLAMDLVPDRVPYPFDLWPHFGLGVLVFDVLGHGWRRPTVAAAAAAAAGVAVFAVRHPQRVGYLDRGGSVSLVVSLLFAGLLMGLYRFDAPLSALRPTRLLGGVGRFSYSLYLTHMTLISFTYKGCQACHLLPASLPAYLAVTVVGCLVFARAFYQFFERPFVRSNRVRRPHTAGVDGIATVVAGVA